MSCVCAAGTTLPGQPAIIINEPGVTDAAAPTQTDVMSATLPVGDSVAVRVCAPSGEAQYNRNCRNFKSCGRSLSGRNHETSDICSMCLAQNAHHGNAFTVESEDGLPVLGTTDEQAENLCLPCLPETHAAPCAAMVSLPPAAVAVALPPAVPAPADAENESVSGSEPADEVKDVQIPKVTERPSVERLKIIARSIYIE